MNISFLIIKISLAISFFLASIFILKDFKKWEDMFLPWTEKAYIPKTLLSYFICAFDFTYSLCLIFNIGLPIFSAFSILFLWG